MLCKSDLEDDIASYIMDRLPKVRLGTVFDVGCNVGWFSHEFGKVYSSAQFYMFEPSPPIFEQIEAVLTRFPELHLWSRSHRFQIALGHTDKVGRITIQPNVTVNHMVEVAEDSENSVEVEIITGDSFCLKHGINHIDYLKIDAEGYDMNVLIGFTKMLASGSIDFIQVEAGMSHDNKEHINEEVYRGFLSLFGYKLFRILNQASLSDLPVMSRADIVFIREKAAIEYGRL